MIVGLLVNIKKFISLLGKKGFCGLFFKELSV